MQGLWCVSIASVPPLVLHIQCLTFYVLAQSLSHSIISCPFPTVGHESTTLLPEALKPTHTPLSPLSTISLPKHWVSLQFSHWDFPDVCRGATYMMDSALFRYCFTVYKL